MWVWGGVRFECCGGGGIGVWKGGRGIRVWERERKIRVWEREYVSGRVDRW